MPLKLYYDLLSQPSRAVYMFLKIAGVPFESKPVALRKGEHFGEAFTKINPFQLVPVIEDDGFVLTESLAICKYIIKKHKLPDHWFPFNDLKKEAKMEQYLHWQHANTRLQSAMLFQHLLLIPKMTGKPVDQAQVKNFRKRVTKTVSQMESYFLKDQPYLCGDKVSIADIFGACELMQLYACHENNIYESSPIVKAWMERVRSDINPYFDEGHKMVYRTHEVYQQVASKL